MMKLSMTLASLSVVLLVGCGDSSATALATADQVSMGDTPAIGVLGYDGTEKLPTVTVDAITTLAETNRLFNAPGFSGFSLDELSSHGTRGSAGETSSGAGRVITFVSATDDTGDFGITGTFIERVGDILVPVSGTADFTGNYAGSFVPLGSANVYHVITGSASLTVDFAASSVSGEITNRSSSFTPATLSDVTFQSGLLVDGGFSGTTSGGAFNREGFTASAGEYSGLLTGANADEAIGGVLILHDRDGDAFVETGAFIVE